jgi:hypothetical protein
MSANARYFIRQGKHYDGWTDETTLTKAMLTEPDKISPVITHLMGRDDSRFPLTFLTQGQKGGMRTIEVNDTEFYWDVLLPVTKADFIISHSYSANDKIGLNFQPFQLIMKNNLIREKHTVHTRSGVALRAAAVPPKKVASGWLYTFTIFEGTTDTYITTAEIAPNNKLGMVGGSINPQSHSYGNSSNVETPGKMKNQVSLIRKSYELAGNISNKYVEVQLPTQGGGTTKRWIDYERWTHMLAWNEACEEELWYGKYNRLADGTIPHIDEETGKPIPRGAGLLDQIPHKDTYTDLTLEKIKNTITDVFYGASDVKNMRVVLFTGEGGREEFHNAVMTSGMGFQQISQSDMAPYMVTGAAGSNNLVYGAYFGGYRHVNGHIVLVSTLPIYDYGGQAQVSPRHYKTDRPIESYRMTFVDTTDYDGQNNLVMTTHKRRSMVTGVLSGMADTPYDFSGNDVKNVATDQDKSSVHFLAVKAITARRNTHMFDLQCEAYA